MCQIHSKSITFHHPNIPNRWLKLCIFTFLSSMFAEKMPACGVSAVFQSFARRSHPSQFCHFYVYCFCTCEQQKSSNVLMWDTKKNGKISTINVIYGFLLQTCEHSWIVDERQLFRRSINEMNKLVAVFNVTFFLFLAIVLIGLKKVSIAGFMEKMNLNFLLNWKTLCILW